MLEADDTEHVALEDGTTRVSAVTPPGGGSGVSLHFSVLGTDGRWREVLATEAAGRLAPWFAGRFRHDVRLVRRRDDEIVSGDVVFDRAYLAADGALVRTGMADGVAIEERVAIAGPGRVRVEVRATPDGPLELSRLTSSFALVPDGRALGAALPLDHAWLPALHQAADDVASDHFFRSPTAIAMARGVYAVLIPDLSLIDADRPIPHALDLRVSGTAGDVPVLSYGLCTSELVPHVAARSDDEHTVPIDSRHLAYAVDVWIGESTSPAEVTAAVTRHLWDRYARPAARDVRPQVLPFEEYGRRYAYPHELRAWARSVELDGGPGWGFDSVTRRGSNFHAWENDLHVAYGVGYYARRWGDAELRGISDGVARLILSAPRKEGAFPTVYRFDRAAWEGSLYWTARAADPEHGYDAAAMGVTAWWLLATADDLGLDLGARAAVLDYAGFLADRQRESGAIPTFFSADLSPEPPLAEAGTTGLSGAVLARVARDTGDHRLADAAVRAGEFVRTRLMPEMRFQDFENFYSCCPIPILWRDQWSGIWPQNTLSLAWAADQFLALFHLTGDAAWLADGEYLLATLSLYQQVWSPPFYREYLFGGFGVMNTDGEWNDGRQSRFVSTYADYFAATGDPEHLERAIAAARAAFALMDIAENHANGIQDVVIADREDAGIVAAEVAGQGYAPENVHHTGPAEPTGWSGFGFGAGGALAGSAYLDARFGSVWVDRRSRRAFGIDGAEAEVVSWDGDRIELRVADGLRRLASPYRHARTLRVRFGHLDRDAYEVVIGGRARRHARVELEAGIEFAELP